MLRLLGREGAGADIVSGGELFRALRAGIDPKKIVYAGVGKRRDEIEYALKVDILMFNVESGEELLAIDQAAKDMHAMARIALRVNPNIDPKTHAYISTGLKENKFGIPIEQALEYYQMAKSLSNVEVSANAPAHRFADHRDPAVRGRARKARRVRERAQVRRHWTSSTSISAAGSALRTRTRHRRMPKDLAKAIQPLLREARCTLVLEPGRAIVGNAGILVTSALYHKASGEKRFLIVDAGMNDLIRPSLYEAYHEIKSVSDPAAPVNTVLDVVGPICESGDFLAKEREMPEVKQGELLAVMGAGAYGFSMSSNYNSRPRVAEVMVKGSEYYIVRERETYSDLVRGEKVPRWLEGWETRTKSQ